MKKEKYEIGDIVFVSKYKYENGEDGNNHLFVIISNDNEYIPIEYFGMIVSSQIKKAKYKSNVKIIKNNENGLHQDSIVKIQIKKVLKINTLSLQIYFFSNFFVYFF